MTKIFVTKEPTRSNWAIKVREFIIDVGQNNRRYGLMEWSHYIPEKGRRRKRRQIFEK